MMINSNGNKCADCVYITIQVHPIIRCRYQSANEKAGQGGRKIVISLPKAVINVDSAMELELTCMQILGLVSNRQHQLWTECHLLTVTVSVLPINGASTHDDCSGYGVVQRRLQPELGHDEARQLNTQRRQISARSGITSRKGV